MKMQYAIISYVSIISPGRKNKLVNNIVNWDQSTKASMLDKNLYYRLAKYTRSTNIDDEFRNKCNNTQ